MDRKQEKNDTKINYFSQLTNFTFYEIIKCDDLVKSPIPVIASSLASGGATWQSHYFKNLQKLDRRASPAMTPFPDFLRVHQVLRNL
jgi:hypothetical protein